MKFFIEPVGTLKNLGIKLGVVTNSGNERAVGVGTHQTVLQQQDLDAVATKAKQVKHTLQTKFAEAKDKVQEHLPGKGKQSVVRTEDVPPTQA